MVKGIMWSDSSRIRIGLWVLVVVILSVKILRICGYLCLDLERKTTHFSAKVPSCGCCDWNVVGRHDKVDVRIYLCCLQFLYPFHYVLVLCIDGVEDSDSIQVTDHCIANDSICNWNVIGYRAIGVFRRVSNHRRSDYHLVPRDLCGMFVCFV